MTGREGWPGVSSRRGSGRAPGWPGTIPGGWTRRPPHPGRRWWVTPRRGPGRPPGVGPSRRRGPGAVATASLRDRVGSVGAGSWSRRLEDDLLDPDPGGPLRPLVYTAACYLVPAVLVFLWLLTLDGQAPAGCVTDISGGGCELAPGARLRLAGRGGAPVRAGAAEQSGGGGRCCAGWARPGGRRRWRWRRRWSVAACPRC